MERKWFKNVSNVSPVETGTLVDVKYRDGEIRHNLPANSVYPGTRDASRAFWYLEEQQNDIVEWRHAQVKEEPIVEPVHDSGPEDIKVDSLTLSIKLDTSDLDNGLLNIIKTQGEIIETLTNQLVALRRTIQ